MLAVIIRLEGTLAHAGVPLDGATTALHALIGHGVPLVVAADGERDDVVPAELDALLRTGGVTVVSPASLGDAPFSAAGLIAIGERLQLPPSRIYVISADAMDVAAATLAMMPTLHVGGLPDAPRSVPDLAAAVARLREPYTRAALELRAVFEGFHARRRRARAAESGPASER